MRPVRFEPGGIPQKSPIPAYETWQVFRKVLHYEIYIYSNDSISVGSNETCQVWIRWHTAKVSHTRVWNLTGLRKSLKFRVSYPCERFGQRIWNLTGLRKSLKLWVSYPCFLFASHRRKLDLSGLNPVAYRKVSHTRLWNLTGLRKSLAFRVLYVFKRFNQHRYR